MRFVRPIAKVALVAAVFAAFGRWIESKAISKWRSGDRPPPRRLDGAVSHAETGDGARLRMVELGEGPLIVLAHGIGGKADHWAPIAQNLADAGFSVVAYDQRGHHQSTRGNKAYTPDTLGSDLITVLQSTGRRAVVVAGHSMGGIAIQGALSQGLAELADSMVLVATLHKPTIESSVSLPDAAFGAFLKVAAHPRHGIAAMRGGFGEVVHYDDLDELRASWAGFDRQTFADAMAGLSGFDLSDDLRRCELRSRVICGEDDKVTPIAFSEQIAELAGADAFERLDGIGHMITWEAADRVQATILAAAAHG